MMTGNLNDGPQQHIGLGLSSQKKIVGRSVVNFQPTYCPGLSVYRQ